MWDYEPGVRCHRIDALIAVTGNLLVPQRDPREHEHGKAAQGQSALGSLPVFHSSISLLPRTSPSSASCVFQVLTEASVGDSYGSIFTLRV